ncbi:MAG: hypothetical protein P8127_11920 [Acidobacteriota bacterium]
MPENHRGDKAATPKSRVEVRVEAELEPRLRVGTCWKVVASSVGSLWDGAYTITFEEIEDRTDTNS